MAATNRAVGYELVEGSLQVRPLSTTKANAFVGAGGLCSESQPISSSGCAPWLTARC